MSYKDNGGAAFPVADLNTHGTYGMTLRDWFAGQAMAAIINKHPPRQISVKKLRKVAENIAYSAYAYADAMLIERNYEDEKED